MTPHPDLKAHLLAQVAGAPSAPRAIVRLRSRFFFAATLLLWAGAVAVLHFNQGVRPTLYLVITAAGWALVAAAASWLALSPRRMTGLPRVALLGIVFGAPALLSVLTLAASLLPGVVLQGPRGIDPMGAPCRDISLALAGIPLMAYVLLRRRIDPVHPGAVGAALGTAAASWAGLTLALTCPSASPQHLLLGHVLPLLGSALLGLALGNFFLALKRPSETD